MIGGEVVESVGVGRHAQESGVLARCAGVSGAVPLASREQITVCVFEVAQHVDELRGQGLVGPESLVGSCVVGDALGGAHCAKIIG